VVEEQDSLVCDGKTLRGSIDETPYVTDGRGEIQALRQLLG
jgi:hypothetical protein